MMRAALAAAAVLVATLPAAPPAKAHPHVFLDAGVDLVFAEGGALEALTILWRLDEFETLYALASVGVIPDEDGHLAAEQHRALVTHFLDWPEGFDGFARLSVDGETIVLGAPKEAETRLVDGRLELRFARTLPTAIPLTGRSVEVAVYEDTYFYALALTDAPDPASLAEGCTARVIPFEPDAQLAALQVSLFDIGRDATPEIEGVGALFADRMVVTCASS